MPVHLLFFFLPPSSESSPPPSFRRSSAVPSAELTTCSNVASLPRLAFASSSSQSSPSSSSSPSNEPDPSESLSPSPTVLLARLAGTESGSLQSEALSESSLLATDEAASLSAPPPPNSDPSDDSLDPSSWMISSSCQSGKLLTLPVPVRNDHPPSS